MQVGHLLYPYLFAALLGPAYLLVLPAIAELHVRMRFVRHSGAVLGTIAGLAAAVLGAVAAQNADLRPAALLGLGMWWWTIGKMAAETGILPRRLGLVTATLGILAITAMPLEVIAPLVSLAPGAPELPVWIFSRYVLAAWLLAFALALARGGASRSRDA